VPVSLPVPVGLDELPPVCEWPVVELDGERWHVAPVYLAPVSRAQAVALAEAHGCELPSPELVDAIWAAADLRLSPNHLTRDWRSPKDMVAFDQQARAIEREIYRAMEQAGRPSFELLVGSHKDFARMPDGRVDLYGWHTLRGVPIERGRTSHGPAYVDYSQGLRLVRRCP
jgi:hypothetical protein